VTPALQPRVTMGRSSCRAASVSAAPGSVALSVCVSYRLVGLTRAIVGEAHSASRGRVHRKLAEVRAGVVAHHVKTEAAPVDAADGDLAGQAGRRAEAGPRQHLAERADDAAAATNEHVVWIVSLHGRQVGREVAPTSELA